jgi:hypothetical protein
MKSLLSLTLKDAIDIFGLVSIVGSLIFIGFQFKQDQDIAKAGQYQSRAESAMANRRVLLEGDAYLSAKAKAREGKLAELTTKEQVAYNASIVVTVIAFDNVFYQHRHGFISEEYWLSSKTRFKQKLRSTYFQKQLKSLPLEDQMVLLIGDLIKEIENE